MARAIGSPTTTHGNKTATSFRLLGMGLWWLDMRYGICSREERSQAHDAGEGTVGYLVIIYKYITAITYRSLAMDLAEITPPPPTRTCGKTRVMHFSTLGSKVKFKAYILPIHHSPFDIRGRDFSPSRTSTQNERLFASCGNPLVSYSVTLKVTSSPNRVFPIWLLGQLG